MTDLEREVASHLRGLPDSDGLVMLRDCPQDEDESGSAFRVRIHYGEARLIGDGHKPKESA